MRLALAGLLVAVGLGLSLVIGWSWSASPSAGADDPPWQVRELSFLKGAYDRIQEDLARPTEGSASLQEEQRRIVRRMTEVAAMLPPEAVPAAIRPLVEEPPVAPRAALSQLIEAVAAESDTEPDLRAGLGNSTAPAALDTSEFAIDPELRRPITHPVPRRKPRARAQAAPPAR